MKIVNFVQEQGNDATVKVKNKNGVETTVLVASLVTAQMSAEDKNMRIAGDGATIVTVTGPANGNAFITYVLVHE